MTHETIEQLDMMRRKLATIRIELDTHGTDDQIELADKTLKHLSALRATLAKSIADKASTGA